MWRNLETAGPPALGEQARAFGREIQKTLRLEPMDDPFIEDLGRLVPPREAEAAVRRILPGWQRHYAADDYVEYTWHVPTARLYVARAALRPPRPGYIYPDWAFNALGGVPPCIDPMIVTAAKCVGSSLVELLTAPEEVARARAEFAERTGGGVGGTAWIGPLLPKERAPPIAFRWPEYVSTPRGQGWWIPA
ncbi:MAG: hypothetical protein ACREGL_07255 [Alphaproteobacteria bacterium]